MFGDYDDHMGTRIEGCEMRAMEAVTREEFLPFDDRVEVTMYTYFLETPDGRAIVALDDEFFEYP